MKKELLILLAITIIGGFCRFWNLGGDPLWIDEAWFGFLAYDSKITQEFVPAYLTMFFGFKSEFGLRFLSAFCGTLTIPAMYYVVKIRKLELAALTAVLPLFVFWSRMARPYAIAGLFLVLSWRWWYFMVPAVFTTPVALVGLKIIKQKKYILLGAGLLTTVLYFIREDSGRGWTLTQFLNSPRWWYLPVLGIMLYASEISYWYSQRSYRIKKK
jgi:hypothetical protein